MTDENTPAVEQGTGTPMEKIPTEFRDYNRWRDTGALPTSEEAKPSATALASAPEGEPSEPVKTDPEPEPDDTQEPDEAQTPRPSSRQRRIDRLTRENADLQKRLQALEEKAKPPAAEATPPRVDPNAKPDLKDFTTLEAYTEALTDWKLNQREAERQAAEEKRTAQTAAQSLQDNWTTRERAALKAHPDYRELMEATEIPAGPGVLAMRQALLEEESGAEILYWLASRPEELQRIAALSPSRAILEIGKLAASFGGTPETPKSKITSAPRPPSPLPQGSGRVTENVYDEATAKDFKRWNRVREAQLKG